MESSYRRWLLGELDRQLLGELVRWFPLPEESAGFPDAAAQARRRWRREGVLAAMAGPWEGRRESLLLRLQPGAVACGPARQPECLVGLQPLVWIRYQPDKMKLLQCLTNPL